MKKSKYSCEGCIYCKKLYPIKKPYTTTREVDCTYPVFVKRTESVSIGYAELLSMRGMYCPGRRLTISWGKGKNKIRL